MAWLPGAVLFRLPILDREKRAALDAEERLFWTVILSLTISIGVVLALAAVDRYTFGRLLVADAIIAAGLAGIARFNLRLGPGARKPNWSVLLPLSLAVLGLWRFFPPSEYVMGGKDPGTYMNEGLVIAQRGAIVYTDPLVAAVPPFARDLFFPSHLRDDYYSVRFMGFWIRDPDKGTVVGQFPHAFPASIAIGYGVNGLTGARQAVGCWAVLGLLAVYFAGARFAGRAVAGTAAALLALNVLQVWFARYPNAEVMMQAVLFAALLATARAHVDGDRFFAPVAGVLLGFLLFLRFDAVLAIAAVLATLALTTVAGTGRLRASFFLGLAAVIAFTIPYLFGPMRAYLSYPIVFLSNFAIWQYGLLVSGAVLLLAALAIGARMPRLGAGIRPAAPTILAVTVIALAVYALYFRVPVDRVLAERDAYALRTFASFYLTVPALLAALVGFALWARRAFWNAPELFVTVAVFSLFFFYKIRIVSDHFWMARRFLPVILPGALLFACAAAFSGTRGGGTARRVVGGTVGAIFVGVLASQYVRAAQPIMAHVEYAGVIPKLEEIAARVNPRDLLVVESRDASDTHVLALPLAYIYDRHVLVLSSRRPDKPTFAAFLDWARTRFDRVLFMGAGGTDLLSPSWDARPVASERFDIPEYDAPADAYPRMARRKEFDYTLYELTEPVRGEEPRPFDLDVGSNDDLHLVRFYSKEQSEGRSFRWTRDRSIVSVADIGRDSREVVIVMSDGGRPPAVPRATVAVALAGESLGTATATTGFAEYAFAIPPALAAKLSSDGRTSELVLTTSTWKPERVLGTADDRDLGVMVDRVTIR